MKTLKEIKDSYAIKQGFKDWIELINYSVPELDTEYHYGKVIQLLQDELKKDIAKNKHPSFLDIDRNNQLITDICMNVTEEWNDYIVGILNTSNIK